MKSRRKIILLNGGNMYVPGTIIKLSITILIFLFMVSKGVSDDSNQYSQINNLVFRIDNNYIKRNSLDVKSEEFLGKREGLFNSIRQKADSLGIKSIKVEIIEMNAEEKILVRYESKLEPKEIFEIINSEELPLEFLASFPQDEVFEFDKSKVGLYKKVMQDIYNEISQLKDNYQELAEFNENALELCWLCPRQYKMDSSMNITGLEFFCYPCRDETVLLHIDWGGYPYIMDFYDENGNERELSDKEEGIHIHFTSSYGRSQETMVPKEEIYLSDTNVYLRCKIWLRNKELEEKILEIVRENAKILK